MIIQTGKGGKVVVLDAITQDGFVPGARFVFTGTTTDGEDYHQEMCADVWLHWFKSTFIDNPDVTGKVLVCIDNASYHSSRVNNHSLSDPVQVKAELIPVTKSLDVKKAWCVANGVSFVDENGQELSSKALTEKLRQLRADKIGGYVKYQVK